MKVYKNITMRNVFSNKKTTRFIKTGIKIKQKLNCTFEQQLILSNSYNS